MDHQVTVSAHKDIATLAKGLDEASTRLKEANATCNEADGERTAALNGLNLAQQAVDEWLEWQKKDAPTSSDWAHA